MLVDATHWLIAFLIALSVHLAGLLWFDPGSRSVPQILDLASDEIVVRLGVGSGSSTQTAILLDQPKETQHIKPADTATSDSQASVQEPNKKDIEKTVDEVTVPPVVRRTLDLEAVKTPASKRVTTVAPEREISDVQATVTAKPLMTADDTDTPSIESVVAEPLREEERQVIVSSTARTRVEIRDVETAKTVTVAPLADEASEMHSPTPVSPPKESQGTEITETVTAAPLVYEAGDVPDSNVVLSHAKSPARSEEIVQSELAPAVAEPEHAQISQTEAEEEVQSVSLAAVVVELDEVEEVTVAEQSTAVTQPLPTPAQTVQTPNREQLARAVTLEELQGGSGVSARYAGILKGWLRENMHYPRAARLARQEGRAIVRFRIDRNGKVLSIRLEQGSGHRVLDREAVEMIERADPFPVMPVEMIASELELRVPIVFEIHDESLIRQIPPIYLE